jgi:predicted MFS family arabinose efflux permease
MPNPYASLLRVPGGPAFSSAAFLARLPISMLGIGLVLLIASDSGRYGLAGAVAAVYALAGAIAQPRLSRLVDRFGQARAVPAQVLVAVLGLIALVLLSNAHAPAWTLFVVAAIGGGAYPNIGALVRARWSKALTGTPDLRVAFSLESVLDELIFIIGPPAVTVVAARLGAGPALLGCAALLTVGSAALLIQRGTEPDPAGPEHVDAPGALSFSGVRLVTGLMVMAGGVFGSIEVITVAYANERHEAWVAGVLLALYSASSLIGGLVYGARHFRTSLTKQLAVLGGLLPLTVAGFPFAERTAVLGLLLFLAGCVVAPVLIATFQLVQEAVPASRLTEGLTWALTGITFGVSVGSAIAGWAIDKFGTPHAYFVTLAFGFLMAAVALPGGRWVTVPPAETTGLTRG